MGNCIKVLPSAAQPTLAPSSVTETESFIAVLITVVLFDLLILTKKLSTVPFNKPSGLSSSTVPLSPRQIAAPPVPVSIQVSTNLSPGHTME